MPDPDTMKGAMESLSVSKPQPADEEAEMAVLGCMLLEHDACAPVTKMLRPEDFYNENCQKVYEVLAEMYAAGKPIDHVTAMSQMKDLGIYADIGGGEFLMALTDTVPSVANATHYSNIIKQKSIRRQVLRTSFRVFRDMYDQKATSLADAEKAIRELDEAVCALHSSTTSEPGEASMKALMAFGKTHQTEDRCFTGLWGIDDIMRGLRPSHLTIVAARPGMGKTTFALNVARHNAKQGKAVLFFTMEMSDDDLWQNVMIMESGVPGALIEGDEPDRDSLARISQTQEKIAKSWPLWINHAPNMRVEHIIAESIRMKKQRNIKLIVVDYLQLMEPPKMGKNGTREQEISALSRRLKGLAMYLNVPVMVLSQLNRNVENREGHRPRLSDLRESGSLEQDADEVVFLLRKDLYGGANSEFAGKVEVIVAKNRRGETGEEVCDFIGQLYRIQSIQPEREKRQDLI